MRNPNLIVWAEQSTGQSSSLPGPETPVKLRLDQVLYAAPNPDRTRKKCSNCWLWQSSRELCSIHDELVMVTGDMVCGYHVYGEPTPGQTRENLQPVDPATSGLEQTAGGTACEGCRFFEGLPGAKAGVCHATWTLEGDTHPIVDTLGCCAAWESRG